MRYPMKLVNDTPASVNTTSTLVLAANSHRKYALLINASDSDMWLRLGNSALVGTGIFVAKGGFAYEIDGNNLWIGDIYAIHSGSGAKALAILELS